MNEPKNASHYSFRTGELTGEPVCRWCGTLARVVPIGRTTQDWHDSAECVAEVEPIR